MLDTFNLDEVSDKISKLMKEGKDQKQAIAAALSMYDTAEAKDHDGDGDIDSDDWKMARDKAIKNSMEEEYCEDKESGKMSQGDLRSAARNALLIDSLISESSNLPEWAKGKLTLAADYLNSVAEYVQHPGEDRDLMFSEDEMDGPDPCWRGYEMVGTKMKNGKQVPNCVKKGSSDSAECDKKTSYGEVKVPTGWSVTESGGTPGGKPTRKSHLVGDQDKSELSSNE